jgi:hypothetical protein
VPIYACALETEFHLPIQMKHLYRFAHLGEDGTPHLSSSRSWHRCPASSRGLLFVVKLVASLPPHGRHRQAHCSLQHRLSGTFRHLRPRHHHHSLTANLPLVHPPPPPQPPLQPPAMSPPSPNLNIGRRRVLEIPFENHDCCQGLLNVGIELVTL